MKRYSFQILSIFLITLIVASQTFAGWQREVIDIRNDAGTISDTVSFWVNQSGQQSSFTIYKPGSGLRTYITFFGTTWPEFKRYMKLNDSDLEPWDTASGYEFPNLAKIMGMYGGIDMTDGQFDGGDISIEIGLSDYFYNQYGKQVEVAISIFGNPGQRGSVRDIEIIVNNANIRRVEITFPKPATTVAAPVGGLVTAVGYDGEVTVECNEDNNSTHGGNIGGIIVNGGFIGDVEAPGGCDVLIARSRKLTMGKAQLKKLGVTGDALPNAFAGYYTGDVEVRGRIVNLFSGNGLGSSATIACGYDGDAYYGRNLKKIILPKGAIGAEIAAGSKPGDDQTKADFCGSIGKVVVGTKKRGQVKYDGDAPLSGCTFTTRSLIRVKGPGAKKGSAFLPAGDADVSICVLPWGEIEVTEDNFGN